MPRTASERVFRLSKRLKRVNDDGREVLFDLDGMRREEIEQTLTKTLGKIELVARRKHLESIAKTNPADFGSKNER
ncbi:hypothetical protein GCK72_016132 [Caenorhabditis remanei]|uniref:Uncharacterized protein n=1 Tax=Caenorhabditis remanei TaxID=31234 RepID=A0A6A5GYM9_CAERE|nr:hypothetical protein GCK72_016132 [Caenorhabditis remanei]KAF1759665.1 hypothetical protein GCK72_016132 [Caenorhabditis remanei]